MRDDMLENNQNRKAYLVGGGIGSLAAAAFMIRDAGMQGKNITIYEAKPLLGGSLDAAPIAEGGYSLRGGRMLTTDNYECMWDLYKTIPSLNDTDMSVYDEVVSFNKRVKVHSQARLIDRNRSIVDVSTMGFTMRDGAELLILSEASEEK
jgi:oleate hydratase